MSEYKCEHGGNSECWRCRAESRLAAHRASIDMSSEIPDREPRCVVGPSLLKPAVQLKPQPEALEMARALIRRDGQHQVDVDVAWTIEATADALQKLMDERDHWYQRFAKLETTRASCCDEMEQRAKAAEADAALAWRRVTELQQRGTELVLARRQSLDAVRHECEFANAAAAGYEESARYWERRQRALVRSLQDIEFERLALTQTTIRALVREFYDHDWDGERAPNDADEAKP